MNDIDNIMVSICCITYNQEKYIRQALDSILMQKVDFKYEIIVGEDCSPDNTREILLEYKKNYPDIFRMFLRDKNMGPTRNLYEVLINCRGKYIAFLEGDDYWTDSGKLQKQTDFLEKHPEYMGVAHDFNVVDKYGDAIPKSNIIEKPNQFLNSKFTIKDFNKYPIPYQSATLLYRNFFLNSAKYYTIIYEASRFIGDVTITALVLNQGNIYISDEVMSSYRYIVAADSTNWASRVYGEKSIKAIYLDQINLFKNLRGYSRLQLDRGFSFASKLSQILLAAVLYFYKKPSKRNFFELISLVLDSGPRASVLLVYCVIRKIFILPFKKAGILFQDNR